MSTLTKENLEKYGIALFGSRFQTDLAAALGVNDRTMRRWISGESNIPNLNDELLALFNKKIDELNNLKDSIKKATYSVKAEQIESGWLFIIEGGYDDANAPQFHNKKVKIKDSDMQVALSKALKQLNLVNHNHILSIQTLADKQAEIDFYKKPVPKLFKKLELSFQNSDQVFFQLINDDLIKVDFNTVYIDEFKNHFTLSAEIKNNEITFTGNNSFFRSHYKNEINKIVEILKN